MAVPPPFKHGWLRCCHCCCPGIVYIYLILVKDGEVAGSDELACAHERVQYDAGDHVERARWLAEFVLHGGSLGGLRLVPRYYSEYFGGWVTV